MSELMEREIDYCESQRPKPGHGAFQRFAAPYGHVDPLRSGRKDLDFYPYHDKLPDALQLAHKLGYRLYFGGGKFGVPDLRSKHYRTGYIMAYDPCDQNGRIALSHEYATAYSIFHEIAHALTLDRLNAIYGEGRRLGALGRHRTLREATRALHWEVLAIEEQRILSANCGIRISEDAYQRERNTVLSEATMRAVTGRFTEPNTEGFFPHSRELSLKDILEPVAREAHALGLRGWNELLNKEDVLKRA